MNWNETVARARQGDGAAWSELFDRTQSMVYYTALKLLKNEEAAQDLAQDTYLRAMEHIDTLKEAEAFPGWIKRICVNLCKNHLTTKRPLLLGDDKQDFLLSQEPEVQEDFLPHVYADKMETCRLIDRMVDALPDKLRAAVVLYYYDEPTVAQIADFLQVGEDDFERDGDYIEVTEETVYFFHQGPYRYTISVQLDGTVNQYSVSLEPSEEPPQTQPSPADYKKMYAQTAGFPGGKVSRLMADVTHDGAPELLLVSRNVEDGTEVSYVTVYTLNGEAPVEIYQNSINDAGTSGTQSVYLYHENGKDYLYSLRTQLRSGTAAYDAEIFSLTAEGVQQPLYTHQVHGPLEESRTE